MLPRGSFQFSPSVLELQAGTRIVAAAEDVIDVGGSVRTGDVERGAGQQVRRLVVEQIVDTDVEFELRSRRERQLRVEVELRRDREVMLVDRIADAEVLTSRIDPVDVLVVLERFTDEGAGEACTSGPGSAGETPSELIPS